MTVISYLSLLRIIELFKADVTLFCGFVFSFLTHSISPVMGCNGNVAYKYFTSSLMCSINFSTQSLLWHIFKGSRTCTYANVLCTHHPEGLCVFIFSMHGVLLFVSAFILFILSLYCSPTGFRMLSKSAYSINETLN